VLVTGHGEGEVLLLGEPLSFWGGLEVATGRIIDVHHPQFGRQIDGKVVVMPFARGSSSTASALAEAIHRGTGPAAIVLREPDEIVVLGATVPGELYGEWCPVVVADADLYGALRTGMRVRVGDGGIELIASGFA
jgi:predicted aconitase with swiveling domain